MLVRAFTVSKVVNRMSSTTLASDTHYSMCSFEYCHLLELYVKYAALYRTFIPQSFIAGNNSNGPVAGHTKYGRIWGMVVDEGGRYTGVLL